MEKMLGVVVVMLCAAGVVLGCSPEGYREIHMDEMAYSAPIIAYGRVLKRHPFDVYEPSAYTAEFLVKCTYKGGPIPERINITGGGYMSGLCGNRNFTVGMEYFAFLSQLGDAFLQEFDQTMEASSSMQELLGFCGLQMEYPADMSEEHETCPDVPGDSSNCHRFQPAPLHRPPPPFLAEANPAPAVMPDPGSGDEVTSSETGLLRSSLDTTNATTNSTTSLSTRDVIITTVIPDGQNGSSAMSFPVFFLFAAVLLFVQ